MMNRTLNNEIECIKKELDEADTKYKKGIEDSDRLGVSVREIRSYEEIKRIESTAYSAINRLKGIDEEYRLRAVVLYNSITSILNH